MPTGYEWHFFIISQQQPKAVKYVTVTSKSESGLAYSVKYILEEVRFGYKSVTTIKFVCEVVKWKSTPFTSKGIEQKHLNMSFFPLIASFFVRHFLCKVYGQYKTVQKKRYVSSHPFMTVRIIIT